MLDLNKGEKISLDLKKISKGNKMNIGLGWDSYCDLDAHAVLRGDSGEVLKHIYYGSKNTCGVNLNGDNLTGEGSGDDETIYLDLNRIRTDVKTISIYVDIFNGGRSFKDVKGCYIRIVNPETEETLARANLNRKDFFGSNAVHFADIAVGESLDFEVVCNGGVGIRRLIDDYKKPKKEPKKRFFGLF